MSGENEFQHNKFMEEYEEWKGKIEKNEKWIDVLACEAFKCHTDGPNKGQPIYNANGNLPDKSKIDLLEERIEALEVPQGGRRTRGKLRARSRRKKGGEVKPIDLARAKKELRDEFNLKYKNINSKFDDLNNSVDELRIRIARGGRRKKRTRRRRKKRRKSRRRKRRRKNLKKRTKRRR